MKGYDLSPLARLDLLSIWDRIADDNLDAADALIEEFEVAMDALSKMPAMGHIREELADRSHRFWPIRSYLIVYHPDTKPLEIVRVLHGMRDVASLL